MICRECGRLPFPGNPLDSEGFHAGGCETPRVTIPLCLGCQRMPWNCDCDGGPRFTVGPLTEDDMRARARHAEGP